MDIPVNSQTVVCFDLDDTLYNELDYLKSAYWEIACVLDSDAPGELYSQMISLYRSRHNVFEFLTSNWDISKEELLSKYRYHEPEIQLMEGAYTLLLQIKDAGGFISVLTDGRSQSQRNKVKALGIYDQIDQLLISEELGTEKPNPANYIAVESEFPGGQYTYVADNFKKDFLVPNRRGWHSIGLIDNGKNIHTHAHEYLNLPDHKPKAFIRSFLELRVVRSF